MVAAARAFKFEPGHYGGKPVPVEVTFTQTLPAARATPLWPRPRRARRPPRGRRSRRSCAAAARRARDARAPSRHATVSALVDGPILFGVESDVDGRFRHADAGGRRARVLVYAADHNPPVRPGRDALQPRRNQELAVTYFVERDRYNTYETVVVGARRREEVSRITLRGAEIKEIPGTFGDPFRVIQALPGVGSVVSLLPFPIVRGASPGSTGFLLDGTRVPLLYHLLLGTSVIHPEFIDEIQFYPGGAPAPTAGYVGGIIDGRTARLPRPDEHLVDIDLNLLQTGRPRARARRRRSALR